MKRIAWIALLATLCGAGVAAAHEVRPAYLEINQADDGVYDVLWKIPAKGDLRLGLDVELPDHCSSSARTTRLANAAFIERWRARCGSAGLIGHEIAISGLESTRTDVLARIRHADGSTQPSRVTPSQTTLLVQREPGTLEVARTYLVLGIEHILFGIDHLLFVLALLLLAGSVRRLVGTVTAFTVAHSLTLAASALGWIHVPSAPVEATIALSIVFVAREILRPADSATLDLAQRSPWLVAFSFGLLHGLGFAGALSEVGLPQRAIPVALAFFNIGVELGQLAFVALVLAAMRCAAGLTSYGPSLWSIANRIAVPTAYAIGITASFWLIERTAAFLPG